MIMGRILSAFVNVKHADLAKMRTRQNVTLCDDVV